MTNSFFRFKQFTINQDRCAMKVCQDSCAFGAWIDPIAAKNILDIGTGTGLLSLMLAQRSDAKITALEIDADAAAQALENVIASPYSDQISVILSSLQNFAQTTSEKFDLIICNPPFYQQHLRPEAQARRQAHHDDSLSPNELLGAVLALLSVNGRLTLMFPPRQSLDFEKMAAEKTLTLIKRTVVYDRPGKAAIRHFDLYSFSKINEATVDELYFKDAESQLSPTFRQMMKNYYLDR